MEIKSQCQVCKIQTSCALYNNNLIKEDDGFTLLRFHFTKGQPIFKQGTYTTGLYTIVSGLVKKTYSEPQQNEVILELAGQADLLGDQSFLDESVNFDYSTKSLSEVEACMIPTNSVHKYLSPEPRFKELLLRLTRKHAILSFKLKLMIQNKNVKQRIAQILLYLQDKSKENSSDVHLLSREDLATMSYTTSESVTRFLSELKKLKVVDVSGSTMRILEVEQLKKIAKSQSDWHVLM